MDPAFTERFSSARAVDTAKGFDAGKLRGKTVIITGGGSGIGEASVRGFVKAGAFVAFSDISQDRGDALTKELGSENVVFIQGDVMNWSDQKNLFKTAIAKSPKGSINIVFANAAFVNPTDDILKDEVDADGDPVEPNLGVAEVHLRGMLLTAKLAIHYFRRQLPKDDKDHCLILTASIAAYWDHTNHVQYAFGKWGTRGMMRSLRVTVPESEMRVNIISPWFLRTNLVSDEVWKRVEDRGYILGEKEDAAKAVMHLASDQSIHGRSFLVIPREAASHGYIDANRDNQDVEVVAREEYSWKKSDE